jgi:hypothetical protein
MIDVPSVSPGVRAILHRYDNKERRPSWFLIPGPQEESGPSLRPLDPPAGHSESGGPPILSTDGRWVAWLEAIPDTGPPVLDRVLRRPRKVGEKQKVIDLNALGPATNVLKRCDCRRSNGRFANSRLAPTSISGNNAVSGGTFYRCAKIGARVTGQLVFHSAENANLPRGRGKRLFYAGRCCVRIRGH